MDLLERTKLLLNELVNFKLAYDVSCYLSDRARADWRSFEMEQHEEYPIKGCGLVASREHVANWTLRRETILHLEEDLAPEETGAEIDSFSRDTVATTYVFFAPRRLRKRRLRLLESRISKAASGMASWGLW